MALVGIDPGATRKYVSKFDPSYSADPEVPNGDDATVFTLRALTSKQLATVRDKVTRLVPDPDSPSGATADLLINDQAWETVRYGLAGWVNFKDTKGNDIPFKTNKENLGGSELVVVKKALLSQLDLQVIKELAAEIDKDDDLDEDDAKN